MAKPVGSTPVHGPCPMCRVVLTLAAILFAVAVVLSGQALARRTARETLASAGYHSVSMRPALFACMKGRFGWRFTATRAGQPAAGKVCAGGLVHPRITEYRP